MGKIIFSCFFLLLAVFNVNSRPAFAGEERWWVKDNEGWFFYKEIIIPEEKMKDDQPVASPEAQTLTHKEQKLFTERLREKGAEILSTAMQYPTPDNIRTYLTWNKFMLDLSNNFALAWQKELMSDPSLQYDIPMVDATKDVYFAAHSKNEDEIIRSVANRAGLFFFYSSTCPYCERQVRYIREFSETYGFQVKAVSIDGGIFQEFPDTLMDNGISLRLGIDHVPAIFLAFPDEKRFERLSAGLVTFAELKQKVLYYATEIKENINLGNLIN